MPCILFVDELLAAYPDAKVILTNRDEDSWVVSMDKTVFEILRWRSYNYIAALEPVISIIHLVCSANSTKINVTETRGTFLEDLQIHCEPLDRRRLQQS